MTQLGTIISVIIMCIYGGMQLEQHFEKGRHMAIIEMMAKHSVDDPEYDCAISALIWRQDVRRPWFEECVTSIRSTGKWTVSMERAHW